MARVFIGLSLCADSSASRGADAGAKDNELINGRLLDAVKLSDWDKEALPSAMVVGFEELSTQ